MPILSSRTRDRVLAALAMIVGALLFALVGATEAAATQTNSVHLRVEGRDGTLEPGRGYVAGSVRTRRGAGEDCANRDGRPRFPGMTPVGALGLAGQHNDRLQPVRMRSTDFGWMLCQVGAGAGQKSFGSWPGDSGGWLYKVNQEAGSSAIDEARLRLGDDVLVYYAVVPAEGSTTQPLNNGRELALRRVPTRVRPGEPFRVRVIAFDHAGNREIVRAGENVEVRGGDATVQPDANGFARIRISAPGTARLRAVHTQPRNGAFGREHDLASERVEVCARHNRDRCPRKRGTLIRGSARDDRIRATPGDDVIRAGRGNDVVDLRPGGRNRVNCGAGRDRVIVNRGERGMNALRNCQQVIVR